MSAFESMVWTVLGYLAMPSIFIIGFIAVAMVSLGLLKVLGKESAEG